MPELPEVEVAKEQWRRWMKGRRVVETTCDRSRVFRGADVKAVEALRGALTGAERRGKYLLLSFEGDRGLLMHLGMTGKFLKRLGGESVPYTRARFLLDDGAHIHYRDPRMFGRIEAVKASALATHPIVRALGIDPLQDTWSGEVLRDALARSRQDLKVALMDQARVAGLGNIQAAEALFRAQLNPARKPASLTPVEWKRLAKAVTDTIAFTLKRERGDEITYVEEAKAQNPFLVYGQAGKPCPRCATTITTQTQGGRTTFYCPHCQTSPRRRTPNTRPRG